MTLKQKLKNNHTTMGSWITVNSPEIIEIMGQFNFDWLTIDMEHSAITLPQAQQLVRTVQAQNIPALVRVEENNSNIIKRVMDTGADGVIVPMVKSREEASRAVEAVKYPPKGRRGVGLTRAQRYGFKFDEYKEWLEQESVVVVIIEHIEAMTHLEDILSVEGVDASMIGPYDLSGTMGYPGEFERDEVKKLLPRYVDTCQFLKKPAGYHVVHPQVDLIRQKMEKGFQFLAFSTDMLFLGYGIQEKISELKQNV